MRIVQVASEFLPLASVGNLGEAVHGLSRALAAKGHKIHVFLPGYRHAREHALARAAEKTLELSIEMGDSFERGEIWRFPAGDNITVHLVCRDEYFDRGGVYANASGRVYDDNPARFIFFSKAVAEALLLLNLNADICHCHDWPSALAPLFLRYYEVRRGSSAAAKTVFTVHNAAFQGLFPGRVFGLMNLPSEVFTPDGLEFYGQVNFLKAGLICGDYLTTVSPGHREETLRPEGGRGLEGLLAARAASYTGILHGLDTVEWNPATDKVLPEVFDATQTAGKTACRRALLEKLGVSPDFSGPVFFGRLPFEDEAGQALVPVLRDYPEGNWLLVLGGNVLDANMGEAWEQLLHARPACVVRFPRWSEDLLHLCMAGADFLLITRASQPCGFAQMIAQRFGTLPVAPRVGGLPDTVVDWRRDPVKGTGVLYPHAPQDFSEAWQAALALFAEPRVLAKLRGNAFRQRFEWADTAAAYEGIYDRLLYEGV